MAILLIVIGLVRAPYRMHQEILQERDQLKRSIAPRLHIQSVRAQDSIEKDRSTEPPIKYAAKYIKVLVVNDSATHIKNCRAFLVDAGRITFTKEDSPESVYERAKFSDPIRFLWSLYGQPETTLLSGVPQHFDVLSCNERDNQLGFCGGVSHPLTISGFFNPPGRYHLSVRVAGDDVQTMKFDFAVKWTGECSEIEVDDNGD